MWFGVLSAVGHAACTLLMDHVCLCVSLQAVLAPYTRIASVTASQLGSFA